MLTSELIARIRRIEITTRKLVNESFAGEYHSVFKGRGMEFDEVRQYNPGDDVRTIDWNVTARTGEPYVKSYVEERELTVMLVVDVSRSGEFGTRNWFKRELAVELAAVMSFAATTNNDKVGRTTIKWGCSSSPTDLATVELLIPPLRGRSHVLRMLRDLLVFQTDPRCPAGQVMRHHLHRQPGAVGGEAARRKMIQPHAVLQVSNGVLDLGMAVGAGTDITLALDTIYVLLKRR